MLPKDLTIFEQRITKALEKILLGRKALRKNLVGNSRIVGAVPIYKIQNKFLIIRYSLDQTQTVSPHKLSRYTSSHYPAHF